MISRYMEKGANLRRIIRKNLKKLIRKSAPKTWQPFEVIVNLIQYCRYCKINS